MRLLIAIIFIIAGVYLCTPHYDTIPTAEVMVRPGDTLHQLIYRNSGDIDVGDIDLLESTAITIDKNSIVGPLVPGQRITIYVNYRTN